MTGRAERPDVVEFALHLVQLKNSNRNFIQLRK